MNHRSYCPFLYPMSSDPPKATEFPFCFDEPSNRTDTPAVVHWRNRSRYLTRRGVTQIANALYEYNRGVMGNLVPLAFPIAVLALGVEFLYTPMRHYPYALTVASLVAVLLLHFLGFLTDGTVSRPRAVNARTGRSWLLLAVCALVAIESIPFCVETIRIVFPTGTMGVNQALGFLATVASTSGALRFFSPTSSVRRTAIRLAVGIFSWVIIATLLISLSDYLYFGIPPYGLFLFVPYAALMVLTLCLIDPLLHWLQPKAPADQRITQGNTATDAQQLGTKGDCLTFLGDILRRLAESLIHPFRTAWTHGLTVLSIYFSFVITFIVMCLTLEPYSLACRFSAQTVAELTRPLARLEKALHFDTPVSPAAGARLTSSTAPTPDSSNGPQWLSDDDGRRLLTTLKKQRQDLTDEFGQGWERDYKETHLSTFLPWLHSILTPFLSNSPNSGLYRAAARSGEITEWGILCPLRPQYHGHAVAFLNACTAIDRLSPLTKKAILERTTRHSLGEMARAVQDAQWKTSSIRGRFLEALLTNSLTSKFMAERPDGTARLDIGQFEPLEPGMIATDDAVFDTLLASLFDREAIDSVIGAAKIPPEAHGAYADLLNVSLDKTSDAAQPSPEAMKFPLECALAPFAHQIATTKDIQYAILTEALLACLGRLRRAGLHDDAAIVTGFLETLPAGCRPDSVFDLCDGGLEEWTMALDATPEDLAMIAAGMTKQDATSAQLDDAPPHHDQSDLVLSPFDPMAHVADAFRHSVCTATGSTVDIEAPSDHPAFRFESPGPSDDESGELHSRVDKTRARAQIVLVHRAIGMPENKKDAERARAALGELFHPELPTSHHLRANVWENDQVMSAVKAVRERQKGAYLLPSTTIRLLASGIGSAAPKSTGETIRVVGVGRYGNLDGIGAMVEEVDRGNRFVKAVLVGSVALAMLVFALVFIDPNTTSFHGFYRDSLASAFLMSPGPGKHIEEDCHVRLSELVAPTEYHAKTAPYPLINAAMNVSTDGQDSIRERGALPFLFSPLFVGQSSGSGNTASYVSTATFEARNPSFTVASAMAISGGAASPLMGRYTNWALRLAMVVANVRLGYWILDPATALPDTLDGLGNVPENDATGDKNGKDSQSQAKSVVALDDVQKQERASINQRRKQSKLSPSENGSPMVGLAFSGGGIRSAALNFGIAQGLYRQGMWKFVDYLSTVSGGGYVGTAISVFMRSRPQAKRKAHEVQGQQSSTDQKSVSEKVCWLRRLRWPRLFYEIKGVPKSSPWLHLSDGGHFENLGVYPLLQRKCRLIVVGDGEADPNGTLDGLSRLLMLAEIDLGARVHFPAGDLDRIKRSSGPDARHFTVGSITYDNGKVGWLLYLRSSTTGDEDQVIDGYKAKHAAFPHESTTDQFFTEDQFEAYRRLGEHIVEGVMHEVFGDTPPKTYPDLIAAVKRYHLTRAQRMKAATRPPRSDGTTTAT